MGETGFKINNNPIKIHNLITPRLLDSLKKLNSLISSGDKGTLLYVIHLMRKWLTDQGRGEDLKLLKLIEERIKVVMWALEPMYHILEILSESHVELEKERVKKLVEYISYPYSMTVNEIINEALINIIRDVAQDTGGVPYEILDEYDEFKKAWNSAYGDIVEELKNMVGEVPFKGDVKDLGVPGKGSLCRFR